MRPSAAASSVRRYTGWCTRRCTRRCTRALTPPTTRYRLAAMTTSCALAPTIGDRLAAMTTSCALAPTTRYRLAAMTTFCAPASTITTTITRGALAPSARVSKRVVARTWAVWRTITGHVCVGWIAGRRRRGAEHVLGGEEVDAGGAAACGLGVAHDYGREGWELCLDGVLSVELLLCKCNEVCFTEPWLS